MRNLPKLPLLVGSLAIAACSTTHEFRVASVGDEVGEVSEFAAGPGANPDSPGVGLAPGSPGVGIAPGSPGAGTPGFPGAGNPGLPGGTPGAVGGTGVSKPPLIVASGNVLLGPAGIVHAGGAVSTAAGVVNGTVSAVLQTTSQTVVQMADGASVLVNGVGGSLGETVSIDVAQGQVVGGSRSLVGNTVAAVSSSAGRLLGGVSVAGGRTSGSSRVSDGRSGTLPANAGRILTPVTGVTAVLQPVIPIPPVLSLDP